MWHSSFILASSTSVIIHHLPFVVRASIQCILGTPYNTRPNRQHCQGLATIRTANIHSRRHLHALSTIDSDASVSLCTTVNTTPMHIYPVAPWFNFNNLEIMKSFGDWV